MIYQFDCYKEALKSTLLQRKEKVGDLYTYQNMAKACRVQKTYLSRVFCHDAHLNEDQVYLASRFLGFDPDEAEFVQLLLAYERTVVTERKNALKKRVTTIKERHLSSSEHLSAPKQIATKADLNRYYLDFRLQLVHMAMTIPYYQANPRQLGLDLNIPRDDLFEVLSQLEALGYLKFSGEGFQVTQNSLHLDQSSPIFPAYRQMMRLKGLHRVDQLKSSDCYSFNVLFSANPQVFEEIRRKFLVLLSQIEVLVGDAPPQEVYQMSFDLLPWLCSRN